MAKRLIIIIFIALAACTPQATPVLPTLVPTLAPAAEVTDSPTAEPAQVDASPTGAATRSLPPTWTPTPIPATTLPPPSATTQATVSDVTPFSQCTGFTFDSVASTREFPVSASPIIVWTAVEGAALYRVTLFVADIGGNLMVVDDSIYTEETTFTFDSNVYTFEVGERYGWEVYPINGAGNQMCASVGGELVPRTG